MLVLWGTVHVKKMPLTEESPKMAWESTFVNINRVGVNFPCCFLSKSVCGENGVPARRSTGDRELDPLVSVHERGGTGAI